MLKTLGSVARFLGRVVGVAFVVVLGWVVVVGVCFLAGMLAGTFARATVAGWSVGWGS